MVAIAPLRDINADFRSQATNIVIDTDTGTVLRTNDDGSISAESPQEQRKADREKFDVNLAEGMDSMDLAAIYNKLHEGIEADIRGRAEWLETGNKGADYLGIKLEDATSEVSPQGSIAKVHNTLLLESVMRSWANSRAELLPVSGPVKVRDDAVSVPPAIEATIGHNGGPPMDDMVLPEAEVPASMGGNAGPPPPTPDAAIPRNTLADALEKDFNHYLTVVDKEYYPDSSRMLFSRALLGCQFKKVYRDPILRRPVSRWVRGDRLIVSNDCSHLMGAGRVTEEIPMRRATVLRLQKIGHWIDEPLIRPVAAPTSRDETIANVEGVKAAPELPEDHLHTIRECYCELMSHGLGKDEKGKDVGFPLPYRVTMDKDSQRVLEIRRNWKQGDEDYRARRRYVKFGFVPGLGFYDLGFIHLLGNPQKACTAIERMLIDAGMFNSFPGGLMAKGPGARQQTTQIRVGPSQFQVVETGGMKIQDIVMPLPYKEPSQVLMALGQDIAAQGRRIASVLELPLGEGRVGDVPVGTIMSYIDSISKVPSAIHKDDHMAQQEEFELLHELFVEEPEALWKFARRPARKWMMAAELEDQDLVPAADPNVPSKMHRLIQTQAIVQAAGLPQFQGIPDQRGIWEWLCRTLEADSKSITQPPPPPGQQPPPDPKMMAALAKQASEDKKTDAKMHEIQAEGQVRQQELTAQSQDRAADRASRERVAAMRQQDSQIKTDSTLAATRMQTAADLQKHQRGLVHEHVQNEMDRQHEARGGIVEALSDHVHGMNDRAHEAGITAMGHQHEHRLQDREEAEADRQRGHELAVVKATPKPTGGKDD